MTVLEDRLSKLRSAIRDQDVDAFLVTEPNNRLYLSGFTGSAGALVVTQADAFLITDFRYVEQASEESPAFEVIRQEEDFAKSLDEVVRRIGLRRLGFEEHHASYREYRVLADRLKDVDLKPLKNEIVEEIRMVKDDQELDALRRAADLVVGIMIHTLESLEVGQAEQEVVSAIEARIREAGASGNSFDPIVATGPRSSLPHAKPSSRRISPGDIVLIDMGVRFKGYCSDITRTVVMGEPGPKETAIQQILLEAQAAAIEAIRPGITGKEVDAVSRDIITESGHGGHFGHGLGHGLGLVVHEYPRLSPHGGDRLLQEGMVVTVEPGIYIPGWGGMRLEDMVLVTDNGSEVLTIGCPKVVSMVK